MTAVEIAIVTAWYPRRRNPTKVGGINAAMPMVDQCKVLDLDGSRSLAATRTASPAQPK
jgi:hypothetical protein